MSTSESEDELPVPRPAPALEFRASLAKVLLGLLRVLCKLTGRPLQEPRNVPPELLLVELGNTAARIAQEVDALAAKDLAQSKKIAALEEAAAGNVRQAELASRQAAAARTKEGGYLAQIEALETQLGRLEGFSKQPSEAGSQFEDGPQPESAEKAVYRGLFERLRQAFGGEVSEDLGRLARVMLELEQVQRESRGLQNSYKVSLPEENVSEDWRLLVDGVSEGLRAASKREQELLEAQADLEAKVDLQIEAQAEAARKAQGGALLFSQAWGGETRPEPQGGPKPRSACPPKGPPAGTLQASGTQQFGQSEWAADSKIDFASVKSRLQQIKNKLV